MAVKKTALFVGALAGASIAVAAIAGAGMKLPLVTTPHGGSLMDVSTTPIFAPPPGAPQSFADIFERVSPGGGLDPRDLQGRRLDPAPADPRLQNLPFDIVPPRGGARRRR